MQNDKHSSIEQSFFNYKKGMGIFSEKMPILGEKYSEFTAQCFKEGKLTKREKQLVALGVSLYSQDEYCIIYHVKGCLDQGCTEEDILEVISVSSAIGGGAVMSQGVTLVQEAISFFSEHSQ